MRHSTKLQELYQLPDCTKDIKFDFNKGQPTNFQRVLTMCCYNSSMLIKTDTVDKVDTRAEILKTKIGKF